MTDVIDHQMSNSVINRLINYIESNISILNERQIADISTIIRERDEDMELFWSNINDIIEHNQHNILLDSRLYAYQRDKLIEDLAYLIIEYEAEDIIDGVIRYTTDRMSGIYPEDLSSLAGRIDSIKVSMNDIIDVDKLHGFIYHTLDDTDNIILPNITHNERNIDARNYIVNIYNFILDNLGMPQSSSDVEHWRRVTIYILQDQIGDNKITSEVKSYIQQLFSSYDSAIITGNITGDYTVNPFIE